MFLSDFAKYVAQMEGFFNHANVAWRNNNPGNLDRGGRMETRDANGHAVYLKISDGWADLEDLISSIVTKHPGLTLYTFFAGERDSSGKVVAGGYAGYAPSADPRGQNDPNNYADFMATSLKIAGTVVIGPLVKGEQTA